MTILIDETTRLLVQGITGRAGEFHAKRMLEYGTRVVAGVTPGKGGRRACDDRVPVFDTVAEAVNSTGANASVIFVPAPFALDAMFEAADSELALVVCITEGIPVLDTVRAHAYLELKSSRFVGPNSPGLISPGYCNVGIIPESIATPGSVGVVSRSGTLTYEIVNALTQSGYGQSTCVGIGGDPVVGMSFVDSLKLFQADPDTEQIVLIGEIGGTAEEYAAEFIAEHITKPVTAFVAGKAVPAGRRMGHAGAIVQRRLGSAVEKIEAFEQCGVPVAAYPAQVVDLVRPRRQSS